MKCRQFFRLFYPFSVDPEIKKDDPNKFSIRLDSVSFAKKQQIMHELLNVFGYEFKPLDPDSSIFEGQELKTFIYHDGKPSERQYFYGPYMVTGTSDPIYNLLNEYLAAFIGWIPTDSPNMDETTGKPIINCKDWKKIADHFEALSNKVTENENFKSQYYLEKYRERNQIKTKIRNIINNFMENNKVFKEEKNNPAELDNREYKKI